jgi:hypothetical protein
MKRMPLEIATPCHWGFLGLWRFAEDPLSGWTRLFCFFRYELDIQVGYLLKIVPDCHQFMSIRVKQGKIH